MLDIKPDLTKGDLERAGFHIEESSLATVYKRPNESKYQFESNGQQLLVVAGWSINFGVPHTIQIDNIHGDTVANEEIKPRESFYEFLTRTHFLKDTPLEGKLDYYYFPSKK
ncbi:hypothetical protein KLEB273_gp232 [Bacillus phage vB_BauM_KLEB27-3]|nr:hypothetical protein KLEB273_gp232 [Bacillus phage vB_BauM_KLEB27-3]